MAATVLLVEDERNPRELVRSYLERAGLTVLSTESGAEAITLGGRDIPALGRAGSRTAGRARRGGRP
jgi:CheY-like chemotaxis protein